MVLNKRPESHLRNCQIRVAHCKYMIEWCAALQMNVFAIQSNTHDAPNHKPQKPARTNFLQLVASLCGQLLLSRRLLLSRHLVQERSFIKKNSQNFATVHSVHNNTNTQTHTDSHINIYTIYTHIITYTLSHKHNQSCVRVRVIPYATMRHTGGCALLFTHTRSSRRRRAAARAVAMAIAPRLVPSLRMRIRRWGEERVNCKRAQCR